MRRAVLLASALLLTPAAPALADSPCLADARRLCPQVPLGDGRVVACLEARWNELSGGCIADLRAVQQQRHEIAMDCSADLLSFCRGVAPGEGRLQACLLARWDQLSSTCQDQATRLADRARKVWDGCQPDAVRLCPGMPLRGGQVFLCLKAQESKTSAACQRALRGRG